MKLFSAQKSAKNFPVGTKIFEWEALEYHQHKRGVIWYVVFCSVLFGGAIWAIANDPKSGWLMAFTFLVLAAVYFWAHRTGDGRYQVAVCDNALVVEKAIFPLADFSGFWLAHDETVAVLNLEFKKGQDQKLALQMGENDPEFFRENFAKLNFPELKDKKESLLDLWIRVLKL